MPRLVLLAEVDGPAALTRPLHPLSQSPPHLARTSSRPARCRAKARECHPLPLEAYDVNLTLNTVLEALGE